MARRRRKYSITGDEYTFGGGAASSDSGPVGTLKIARGNMNVSNADFQGFVENGAEWTITLDAGTAIENKDQYVYFDNAFETNTGAITIEYLDGDTALAAGLSWQDDSDSTNTDVGYGRIYGTPSAEGTNRYKIKYDNQRGDTAEVTVTIKRFPLGTTPVWSTSVHKFNQILQNTAGDQVLADGPTTTYADAVFSLSGVSGFPTGITPIIDTATGEVKVTNVGAIVQAPSPHQYTVTADLGSEIGTFTQTFTGDIGYGDPYGSALFSPANARVNFTSGVSRSIAQTQQDLNFNKGTGALRRYENNRYDTSPYLINDGYGCEWATDMHTRVNNPSSYANNTTTAYRKNGSLGFHNSATQVWQSSSNYQTARFRWVVPNGVTQIAVCCIGGGSMGAYNWSADGGGGAGLAWMNGISVTPGEEFIVGVGLGRYSESSHGSYGGGPSFLIRASTGNCLIYAQQGGYTSFSTSSPNGQSSSYTGGINITGLSYWNRGNGYNFNNSRDGGGYGMRTSEGSAVSDGTNSWHYGGGAAGYCNDRHGVGAGGYVGQNPGSNNTNGEYGGGGSGNNYSSTYGQGGGGGTGLDGQGWRGSRSDSRPDQSSQAGSGYGGTQGNQNSYYQGSANYRGAGGGGSGGSRGVYRQNQYNNGENSSQRGGQGGMHGGGGGGSGTSWGGGNGGSGGVKIIWGVASDGTTRCYPYNYTTEKKTMKIAGQS